MTTITSFPARFGHINKQVDTLNLIHALSPDDLDLETQSLLELLVAEGANVDYRSCDFYIILKDGSCFGFSACTPEYLRDMMERSGTLSFVEAGLLLVSEMTLEAILTALEEALSSAHYYGLEHFGYRCT